MLKTDTCPTDGSDMLAIAIGDLIWGNGASFLRPWTRAIQVERCDLIHTVAVSARVVVLLHLNAIPPRAGCRIGCGAVSLSASRTR